MERYPGHRAIPYTTGHLVLVAAMLTGAALLAARRAGLIPPGKTGADTPLLDNPWTWALLYCAAASGIVWGIMAIHYVTGPEVPYLLLGWLPYRLMNHVAPILIPLLVAIGFAGHRGVSACLLLALLAALLVPLAHLVLPYEVVQKYIEGGDYLFFFLFGSAAGTGLRIAAQRNMTCAATGAVAAVVILGLLAWFHQFGAACTLIGLICPCAPLPAACTPRAFRLVATTILAMLLIALLARDGERRQHLSRSEFHQAVARYLEAEGKPEAMILVQYDQAGDQMRFGHPVMADMATMLHGVYRPPISPSVNAIFQDFYGVYLDPAADQPQRPQAWHEVWPAKSLDEWQRLSEKYHVEFVAAPSFMRLPLDLVVPGAQRNLFRIPDARRNPDAQTGQH
jgi:type IV secretory pathway TrbD component